MIRLLAIIAACVPLAGARAQTRMPAAISTEALLHAWVGENEACRGGSGDEAATWRACERRERVSVQLGRLGLCYGRDDEPGYRSEWHRCGPRSLRRRSSEDGR